MNAEELLKEFNEKYGFVCIDKEICLLFLSWADKEELVSVDNLYDWVLANNLAYEVVE